MGLFGLRVQREVWDMLVLFLLCAVLAPAECLQATVSQKVLSVRGTSES